MEDAGQTYRKQDIIYVSGPEIFRGHRDVHGYFVGTYWQRSDIDEVVQMIRICNNIPYDQAIC